MLPCVLIKHFGVVYLLPAQVGFRVIRSTCPSWGPLRLIRVPAKKRPQRKNPMKTCEVAWNESLQVAHEQVKKLGGLILASICACIYRIYACIIFTYVRMLCNLLFLLMLLHDFEDSYPKWLLLGLGWGFVTKSQDVDMLKWARHKKEATCGFCAKFIQIPMRHGGLCTVGSKISHSDSVALWMCQGRSVSLCCMAIRKTCKFGRESLHVVDTSTWKTLDGCYRGYI